MPDFDPKAAAAFIDDAHRNRAAFRNIPDDIGPRTVAEAYDAQDALRELWSARLGPVKGMKIATTTKVMQELMGIDHPCGGPIYEKWIHASPASLKLGEFTHLMIECELAVRVGTALPAKATPYTPDEVRGAVVEVMPAFELIEDRHAHYKSSRALSLIADNAWNAGIVLGAPVKVAPDKELNGIMGRLTVNGVEKGTGTTDNPMGALAWLANLAVERGRPIEAGMVVITGSVIVTLPIMAGERFVFTLDGLGATEMTAV